MRMSDLTVSDLKSQSPPRVRISRRSVVDEVAGQIEAGDVLEWPEQQFGAW